MSLIYLFLFFFWGIFFLSKVQAAGNELKGSDDSKTALTKKGSDDSKTALTKIVSHIQKGEVRKADEKLLQWVNLPSANFEEFVGSFYANKAENFNHLITYSRASSSVKISQAILTALWRELKMNNDMDFFRLAILCKTFTNSVIKRASQSTDDMRTKANELRTGICSAVINTSTERLSTAVVHRIYRNNNNIQMVANTLWGISKYISDETYRQLIDKVYDKVSTEDLIRDMCSNQNAPQVVTSLVSIYKKIEESRQISSKSTTLMAACLKRLQDPPTFKKLPQEKKNYVTYLASRLPDSIQNLYFAEKVCLRNAYFYQIIYSAEKDFGHTVDGAGKMRYVFALDGGMHEEHSYWIAQRDNDNDSVFTFMSDAYKNEFMFVSETTSYILGYNDVATWIPGGTKGNQSSWEVRIDSQGISFLNLHFNKFLCIDGAQHPPTKRRLVFAKEPSMEKEKCEWLVESCGGEN